MRRLALSLIVCCSSTFGERVIDTVAGGAIPNGVPAASVSLNSLSGIAGDSDGNLYLSESVGHIVRRITPDGLIETFAGTGISGFGGDGGAALGASLYFPGRPMVDASGNLLIADVINNRIRRIDRSGKISTIAGTGIMGSFGSGGPAISAQIGFVLAIAVGHDGTIYFTEDNREQIRGIKPDGRIIVVAGAEPTGSSRLASPQYMHSRARRNQFVAFR